MGLANSQEIENALYGMKGDLKKKLRNNNVPTWLEPTSSLADSSRKYLKDAKDNDISTFATFYIFHPSKGFHRNTPDKLQERVQEFIDEEDDFRVREGDYYDGVHLEVAIGERGGIEDLRVVNTYRN